jgi:hypothetical protein
MSKQIRVKNNGVIKIDQCLGCKFCNKHSFDRKLNKHEWRCDLRGEWITSRKDPIGYIVTDCPLEDYGTGLPRDPKEICGYNPESRCCDITETQYNPNNIVIRLIEDEGNIEIITEFVVSLKKPGKLLLVREKAIKHKGREKRLIYNATHFMKYRDNC